FLTCGRGQRVGVFGGSGVGKSTLIGMMARNTSADLTVLGLIGERGREVGELLNTLGEEGRRRSVVVVSTSDQDPLLRIRAGPLVDAVRALLDGHVMLDRRLAAQSHYPPISILDSISRIMPAVISAPHLAKTNHIRRLFATYKASEELIRIGAYQKGSDPELD